MFSWNSEKALANFKKHNVSFEEATTVFLDPDCLEVEDIKHSMDEKRRICVGRSQLGKILVVVYTNRRLYGEETIRIISARQASRKERNSYSRF